MNNIKAEIYEGTTRINPGLPIKVDSFSTGFPGGLYMDASLTIQDISLSRAIREGQRLVLRNGLKIVYEGVILSIGDNPAIGSFDRKISAAGYWGQLLGKKTVNKPWADMRLGSIAWSRYATPPFDLFNYDQNNRLHIYPNGAALAINNEGRFSYIPPTGQTIKRISFNYDFQEGTGDFIFECFDATNVATLFSTATSGTGSQDITLGTPSSRILFRIRALSAQTPPGNNTVYITVSNIMVYTETGAINLTEIVKDCRGILSTDLNADETKIESNTFSLVPFITNGQEYWNSVLTRAAAFGDASQNQWAVGLLDSESAATPTGKPVLYCKQYPILTDFDYQISMGDKNLNPFNLVSGVDDIYNWIVVTYRDDTGKNVILTPDDDSNLKDTASIAKNGQRELVINAGDATATTAANLGKRYLKAKKDIIYYVSGPITVTGYIHGKGGEKIPASEIRAGMRLTLTDYLEDRSGSGTNLIFLITYTQYDAATEQCQISCGVPDDLSIYLAQRELVQSL